MIKKILSNTLYLAPLLISCTTYPMISRIELLKRQTPTGTKRVVVINNGDHHPKKWPKRNNRQIDQMKSIIRQLERKQTPTQLYVEFTKKNVKRCDIRNRRILRFLESTATGILHLNALRQLKDKDKKDQKNVIYHAFDSRDDLDFNTLHLFINPLINSKKTVESSNNDTDDPKTISITDFIEKYKNKRDSLFTELTTLPEKHKKQESENIFQKFDNFFVLLHSCNEVLQKNTLSELVSELYTIHCMQLHKTNIIEKTTDNTGQIYHDMNSTKLNVKKLIALDTALREKQKLDKEKTIFEQLKESYYIVNYLIPAINLLSLFDKHQSKNDTLVVQCHERYGKNFANKLHKYYGFENHSLSKKLQGTLEITDQVVRIEPPFALFEQ